MRKEIRDLFFKTLASEKESFNKRYEKTDNCLACVRLSAHISENLHSKLDSIARDLYGASRLGFITVEEVEKRIAGVRCGMKNTSCGDQLAKACRAAYEAANA